MRSVRFPDGQTVPALGQGTWRMGEDPSRRRGETVAIRAGVDLGMTVIDTAEMYGEGATETFLGEALAGLRDKVFLVSKVYPQNASRSRMQRACEASLKRLRTDHLDLYLLHWPGTVPLQETVAAMQALRRAGKIRRWGVSNFDVDDMDELLSEGGQECVANQILYNVGRRGPEFDLLPWLDRRSVPAMAYSPVEQGKLLNDPALKQIGARHGAEPLQVALAWVLRRTDVLAIPKASTIEHVRENRAAADLELTPQDLEDLDRAFPPPRGKMPLAML